MSPLEPGYPITVDPEYSNTNEAKEKDLYANYMQMMEFLKEKMN